MQVNGGGEERRGRTGEKGGHTREYKNLRKKRGSRERRRGEGD